MKRLLGGRSLASVVSCSILTTLSRAKLRCATLVCATLLSATLLWPAPTVAAPQKRPLPHSAGAAKENDDFGAGLVEESEFAPTAAERQLALPLSEAEEKLLDSTNEGKTPAANTPAAANNAGPNANGPSAPAPSTSGPSEESLTTVLNVKDAEITSLIKTFSKLVRRNYVVDSNVKGKVTIHLASAVTVEEALKIFDSVLLLKGFTTVPLGENTWKVIPAKEASQTTIPLVSGDKSNASDVLVTQLVRLRHVQAADMQQLLQQFVSKEGVLNSFSGTNSLILIDSQANIERLKKLIHELDVPAADQEITIIPVAHAEAKDIADKISEILGLKEDGDSSQANALRPRNGAFGAQQPIRTSMPGSVGGVPQPAIATSKNVDATRALPVKIIPDERTNSLIVVADLDMTTKVRALVDQLDSQVDMSGGKFYVYRLKFAKADELADTLSQLISGVGEGRSKSSSKADGASGSMNRSGGSSITRAARDAETRRDQNRTSTAERISQALASRRLSALGGDTAQSAGKVQFEGEVAIAPDQPTNSLIINASRGDYLKVKELIDALDVKRPQVFVEAAILEVSLSDSQQLGALLQTAGGTENAGLFAQSGATGFGSLSEIIEQPLSLAGLTFAAASTGTITMGNVTIPTQAAIMRALSKNTNVKVLSSPTILTTDNEEAEIVVGENIPFVTNTSTDSSNLQNTFNQIQRQDVGIKLKLTPQISSNDFVSLKVFVEISNVKEGTEAAANGPTTTIRTAETTVAVRNGQMIATGGLISNDKQKGNTGVPYLQDLPVLGNLFKIATESDRRTNLLILLTPRIIEDQFAARENTIERREQLKGVLQQNDRWEPMEQVLESDKIDRVAEMAPPPETVPSTITPPRAANDDEHPGDRAINGTKAAISEILKSQSSEPAAISPSPKSDTIDITVKPKLPGTGDVRKPNPPPANNSTVLPKSGEEAGLASPPASTSPRSAQDTSPQAAQPGDRRAAAPSGETYVVLRKLGDPKAPKEFTAVDSVGTVGLRALGGTDSFAGQYFSVGGRYKFKSASGETSEFVVLGKFDDPSAAKAINPAFSTASAWYKLTPKETMKLGQGQWKSAAPESAAN